MFSPYTVAALSVLEYDKQGEALRVFTIDQPWCYWGTGEGAFRRLYLH